MKRNFGKNVKLWAEVIYSRMVDFYKDSKTGNGWKWDEFVYFLPEKGHFMHNDNLIYYSEVIPYLLDRDLVEYKGIKSHQGLKLPAYGVVDKNKKFV